MSEPTTGEIVRALRDCLNVGCEECILHETEITPECKSHYCKAPTMLADRLEQQEQRIAELEAENRDILQNSVSHTTHEFLERWRKDMAAKRAVMDREYHGYRMDWSRGYNGKVAKAKKYV